MNGVEKRIAFLHVPVAEELNRRRVWARNSKGRRTAFFRGCMLVSGCRDCQTLPTLMEVPLIKTVIVNLC